MPPQGTFGKTSGDVRGGVDLLHELRAQLEPDLQVIRRLGEESFGKLFLAREVALRRLVVVKVLAEKYARNPSVRRRFQRAALAAARLSHPSVVPIFRVGSLSDGTPFCIQPHLGECTLEERIHALRSFTPAQVRTILKDIAAALAAAHRQGITHRGLNPSAIRCEEGTDRVLLTDFGLATLLESASWDADRLTPSGEILGSVGYMSPEQMAGEQATDRSDVFALGLIGWRLLAGPAADASPLGHGAAAWRAWEESVEDPGLADLIRRCVSRSPHERPSAEDVVRDLNRGDRTDAPAAVPVGEPVWAGLRRRRIPHALLIYGPLGWLTLQIVDQLVQQEVLPRLAYLSALVTVIMGLPVALVLAWHHGPKGHQKVTAREVWMLAGIAAFWIVTLIVMWLGGKAR